MAITLHCRACGRIVVIDRTGELPACEKCGPTTWTSLDAPLTPYMLSENDRRFLRSLRIEPTEETC
jgi:hypothetical protein